MKIIETHIYYLGRLSSACLQNLYYITYIYFHQFNWADLEVSSAAQNLTILWDITTLACLAYQVE